MLRPKSSLLVDIRIASLIQKPGGQGFPHQLGLVMHWGFSELGYFPTGWKTGDLVPMVQQCQYFLLLLIDISM